MYWFLTTTLLFGFCLSSYGKYPPRKYYYINTGMNWSEAQQYCREKYTDLATIENLDDIATVKPGFSYAWAWIGLHDDPNSWRTAMGNDTNSWRWSATGQTSQNGFQKWYTGQPDYAGAVEKCVDLYQGRWYDRNCDWKRYFLCYSVTEENEKIYTYISNASTWNSAQEYCRKHFKDLAMIENEAENVAANGAKPAVAVWIGLYRVPWTWSDKSQSSSWRASIDNYGGHEQCMLKNSLHQFGDGTCSVRGRFVCHQVTRMITMWRMTTITAADLTDPAVNAQILQKLDALLRSHGLTDFKVQWKKEPEKKDKIQCEKSGCNLHV